MQNLPAIAIDAVSFVIVTVEAYSQSLRYPWRFYIWDLGGTLLDNYRASASAFVAALREFGLVKIPADQIYDAVYRSLRISTDQAIADFAPNTPGFLERYRQLEAPHLDDPDLFSGATEVLDAIIAAGGKNFLVSHRDNQVLDILKQAKIADKFTEVVTKDNGFPRKPNPESFDYLIDKYHLDRALTATVGDRTIDIQAGTAAGISTIFFDPTHPNPQATISITALTDLLSAWALQGFPTALMGGWAAQSETEPVETSRTGTEGNSEKVLTKPDLVKSVIRSVSLAGTLSTGTQFPWFS